MHSRTETPQKHRGALGELAASVWLLERGYEVFRNVSSHGAIDLIAIRHGEIFKFDVKMLQYRRQPIPQLTAEQIALGAQILAVYGNGHCEIIDRVPRPVPPLGTAYCRNCVSKFEQRGRRTVFCSAACSKNFRIRTGVNQARLVATPKDF